MKAQSVHGERSRNRIKSWLVLNLLLLGLVAALSMTYPVDELSRRLGDIYFRLRRPLPTSSSVALVLIDDLSLSRYGRWPWPRSLLARLVRATAAQRPGAIGLDILLSEAEDARNDNDLAKAFREAGNVVLAAKVGGSPQRIWADPLPLFLANSAGVGHVQAVEDADGICRSVPVRELSAEGPRWALALEVSRVAKHVALQQNSSGLWLGKDRVWVDGSMRRAVASGWESYSPDFLTINFREQYSPGQKMPPFVVVSAAELLDGRQAPALWRKAVLIGFGATELSDRLPTPVSGQMPMSGVEVHANLVDGVLRGQDLRHVRVFPQVLFLVGFSLISTWLVLRWPGWDGVLLQTALLIVSYGLGYWLFAHAHRIVAFGPLLCAGLLAVPLAQLENLVVVNRGLTRGLRQLRQTLHAGQTPVELASFRPAETAPEATGDLQWRVDLINQLQSELASLYGFRQHLLESIQEGLAVFAADGKTLFRNKFWEAFCRKQGWDPEIDLVEFGRLLGHPHWSNVQERLRNAGLPPESEVYLGGGFWQIRGTRLSSTSSDEASQWMVVVTDLTSRLERDQARADALRFVTHELRTPLVSIQGFAEFLQRYPQATGSADAAATIFRESQRLVSLINTYLDVLRFDAGARSLRREPILIPQMIEQLQRVMSPIAEAAEIRIQVHVDSELPPLEGDPPMLSGVILNLLNNAVKYSPAGSEVTLRVTGTEANVIFEVCNPGAPIPPEDLAHLFEPFYRARATGESTPGWGLGLTFVKRIVEEHRGILEASSDESGIRVRAILPATVLSGDHHSGSLPGGQKLGHEDTGGGSQ
jgi:signal transduction histidine kinase/CHASE2 domain-containing sensor protein